MAFSDPGKGRVVLDSGRGTEPEKVTLAEDCKGGDVLGYSSGWKRALATTGSVVQGRLVALADGKNGEEVLKVLRSLAVDTVILCGVCMPEVKSTAQILAVEPGLRDPERPELGWDIIIPNDCVGDCGEERLFDAKKDLHLLCGNRGSKMKVTTTWELVSKDFDI